MKVQIDHGKCEGFGFCEEAAPAVFRLDDDGYVEMIDPEASADNPQVASAIRVCPVGALKAAP